MKDKILELKEKVVKFIKDKPIIAWAIGTVAIALLVAVIVSAIFSASSSPEGNESSQADVEVKWGEGITEGIPSFSPAPDSASTLKGTKAGIAAYYTEVTSEQVSAYTALIETECGIKFSSDKYPRSAVFGDKIIAIHYNVTEKKMSVTVVKNGETEESD